ncbi:MAG: hypothetical protein NTV98_04045 [Candidatus Roizmanbacteria bacterium]|nr:hypothetical protein [Candidatus Roizmanbacteria bacterium]
MKRKIQKRLSKNKFLLGIIDFKNLLFFLKKNYFLLIFAGCIGFVGLFAFYKIFISKPTYIYVKVKVGQGLWWASTQRPNIWLVRAIEQAKEKKDITGKPLIKILNVSYYPYYGSGQYEVYVTARIMVSMVGSTNTYNFNRETIGISSPIDFELPNTQFSGTIIDMSDQPIKENNVEKIIYLTKKYTYPWEFDEIELGDSFSNGKQIIFEILDKAKGETNEVLTNEIGKLISTDSETYRYIIIKAKIQVKEIDNKLFFAEELTISPGRGLGFITDHSTLNDYFVSKVE